MNELARLFEGACGARVVAPLARWRMSASSEEKLLATRCDTSCKRTVLRVSSATRASFSSETASSVRRIWSARTTAPAARTAKSLDLHEIHRAHQVRQAEGFEKQAGEDGRYQYGQPARDAAEQQRDEERAPEEDGEGVAEAACLQRKLDEEARQCAEDSTQQFDGKRPTRRSSNG